MNLRLSTRKIFLMLLAAMFAATAFAQQQSIDPRYNLSRQRETPAQQADRLATNNQHELVMAQMLRKAQASNAAQPEAISISCPDPVFFSEGGSASIQAVCDITGDGKADFKTIFYQNPTGIRFSALASFGGYLFSATADGSIYPFTDKLQRGIADPIYTPYDGMAYTERLIPVGVKAMYTQDPNRGRLFRYTLDGGAAISSNILPKLAPAAFGTVFVNNSFYFINPFEDAAQTISFDKVNANGIDAQTLYQGGRVTAIALDPNSPFLFILLSGTCNSQSTGPNGTPDQSDQPCIPTQILMIPLGQNPFSQGKPFKTITVGGPLQTLYSFQTSMLARNGKLYVTSFVNLGPDAGYTQQILLYRYTGVNTPEFQAPTVFADQELLGQYPFITSLTSFSGGPVLQLQ